jgi:PTH1 family peptidyl-tRNA hydrolase
MILLVGLGNPGKKYEHTRHNLGFLFLDYLAKKYQAPITTKKFEGLYGQAQIDSQKFILLKPQTMMNLSGHSVAPLLHFFKVELQNLILVHDDLDMEFGKVRYRDSGRSAGHNGLKSIFETLGTENIKRLKIGIGRPLNPEMSVSSYVLEDLFPEERKRLPEIFAQVEKMLHGIIAIPAKK